MSHVKLLSRTQLRAGKNIIYIYIIYTVLHNIYNFSQEQNRGINIQYIIVGPMVINCFYVIMVTGWRSTLDAISMASLFCILDSALLNRNIFYININLPR